MEAAWLDDVLVQEGLPETFHEVVRAVCEPLARLAIETRAQKGAMAVVGVCGAQGSGKSTIAAVTRRLLQDQGLKAAVLSLDDLYLPRAVRERLAGEVHPLLATRGPPGTHDVALGVETIASAARSGSAALPRFDKASDEPRPPTEWPIIEGPLDVVLFEGWCVGARPQPEPDLFEPINELERVEDADGHWRRFVNTALAGAYPPLFEALDRLVLLEAPSFEVAAGWRAEQEAKLRARSGGGLGAEQIARFVAHYERLTCWILREMPARADWTVPLSKDRTPLPPLRRDA